MANTLNLGTDGNWATKEGSLLGYNSESNNYKPLPFDFSRDSKATVINKDGLIEEVGNGQPRIDFLGNTQGALKLEPQRTNLITQSEAFGNSYWTKSGASIQGDPSTAGSELITNGDFATDSDWIKQTGWTISGGVASCDGTQTSIVYLYQTGIGVIGKTYKCEFEVTSITSGSIKLSSNGNDGTFVSSTGTHTEYLNFLGSNCFMTVSADFIGSIDNVSVKEVQGFISPDGTNNAYKLVGNGANSTHLLRKYIGATALTTHSFSFFVKKGEITKLGIREDAQTGNYVSFDLETKTIITQVVMTLTYEEVGDYLKIKISSVIGSNGTAGYAIYMLDDAYTGGVVDGSRVIPNGSGFYIYGAQLEVGSYPTSYIPTQGSAVTRLADTCYQGGLLDKGVLNNTALTLFFNSTLTSDTTNQFLDIIALYHPTAGKEIRIESRIDNILYVQQGGIVNSGDNFNSLNLGANSINFKKIAIVLTTTQFKIFGDGVQLGSTLNGSYNVNFDSLGFRAFNGAVETKIQNKEIKLYNTALSDSELIALTQV